MFDFNNLTKAEAAVQYAELGYYVVLVHPNDKAPIHRDGHLSASKDPDVVRRWWKSHPEANIGLSLRASGLVALDVDTGKDTFEGLPFEPTETWSQTTPNGSHWIYLDNGFEYRGRLRVENKSVPAVDIKHNGYVLVAPSSVGGEKYQGHSIGAASEPPQAFIAAAAKNVALLEACIPNPQPGEQRLSLEDMRSDLAKLTSNLDYEEWVRVLMAIHHETGGNSGGLQLAIEWSRPGEKFVDGEIETKWASFDADASAPVTWGSVRHLIRERSASDAPSPLLPQAVQDQTTASRLLVRAGDIPLTSPEFVIDNLLIREGLSMVFGGSYSGKTFFALDVALCGASGHDFHGLTVNHPGPVIYAAAEGKSGVVRRCYAWCKDKGIDLRDIPFFMTDTSVRLDDRGVLNQLVQEIVEISKKEGRPAAIFFDTLNRSAGSLNENSADDMGRLVGTIEILSKVLQTHVCLIHHTGHEAKNRARGSSALYAAMDQSFEVSGSDGTFRVTNDKMKDGEAPPDLCFDIVDVPLEAHGEIFKSAHLLKRECAVKAKKPSLSDTEKRTADAIYMMQLKGLADSDGCLDKEVLVDAICDSNPETKRESVLKSLSPDRTENWTEVISEGDLFCLECREAEFPLLH